MMELQQLMALPGKLIENISKVIVGKDDVIEKVVVAVLAGGHVLLEDVPGTGKMCIRDSYSYAAGQGEYQVVTDYATSILPAMGISADIRYAPDDPERAVIVGPNKHAGLLFICLLYTSRCV